LGNPIKATWPISNCLTPLEKGCVHIWSFHTSKPSREVESLSTLLHPNEINRAMRMRSLEVREQAIVGRAVLRIFLAGYLGCDPKEVAFEHTGMGKPVLANRKGLFFNLSHSHGLGLIALSSCAEVGVDIEKIRHIENSLFLAERFFSPWESQTLSRQNTGEMQSVFFQAWTRKEAFLKANGHGLGFGLDRVEVSLGRNETPRIRFVDGCPKEAERWTLLHLEPGMGFMGAAAFQGPGNIRSLTWHWDGKENPRMK
jgi:4'-phosphopantetheinyl transferase